MEMRKIEISRRSFVKTGALAIAGFTPVALFSGGARADGLQRGQDFFEGLLGEWMHVDAGGWKDVELVGVSGISVDPRLDQFILTFRGSPHAVIEEGTYDLAPPQGDAFLLHLKPAGADEQGRLYAANFAHFKPLSPGCGAPA